MDRSTIRVAFRTLGRHKGFTTVAILSLAIAIALNTVMYSVLDAVLSPRINARAPDHVYSFWYYGNGVWSRRIEPRPFEDALAHGLGSNVEGFTGSAPYSSPMSPDGGLVEHGDLYKRVRPFVVRANYFEFLGSAPLEGRTFRESDEKEGNSVAVISDRLARHLFPHASPVGQTVTIEGNGFVVIGVVERSPLFEPLKGDFWTLRRAGQPVVFPDLLRLKEIVHENDLKDHLDLASKRLAMSFDQPTHWVAFQGKQIFKGQVPIGPFYYALVFGVAAVLLVACANLANLQLARGLARNRELALRAAVGASRAQLIRLLVLESGILAVVGLTLGLLLTLWGMKVVDATIPEEMGALVLHPQTSWRVFAFAAGAATVCLFLVGLVPALTVSKVDPNEMLKSGAGTGANKEHRKRYGLMVVAQIGFALPVLIGAIVVLRNTWHISRPEYVREIYGYDARQILAAHIPFQIMRRAPGTPPRVVRIAPLAEALLQRARQTAGVIDAAVFTLASPEGRRVSVDGADGVVREEPAHQWNYHLVTPNYLRTIGMSVSRGRDFSEGDLDGNGVVLDAASALYLWKGENPLGRAIKFGSVKSNEPWLRVIGIVRDPRDMAEVSALDYTTGFRMAGAYRVISSRDSIPAIRTFLGSGISMFAKARGSPELVAVRLQRQLRNMAGMAAPVAIPLTDEMGLSARKVRQAFVGSLFSTFALLGLALVAIGVYGIVSHSVAERKRELAVRISLGASARDILHAVMREGNVLLLTGMALGLLLTKYTVVWLTAFIGGGDAYHSLLFALIAAFLFGLAAFAAFVPALRATRIDPAEALRHE
jgi:putative ABC transport system permease protein